MITPAKLYQLYNANPLDTDKWNVFNWSLLKHGQDNLANYNNSAAVISGSLPSVKIDNINGEYIRSTQVYNEAPVYINKKQGLYVGGFGFGFRTDFSSLNPLEAQAVLNDTDFNYYIHRDGPYLLGKFNSDQSWAVIRLPQIFDGDNFVDIDDVDISLFSQEDVLSLIVISQLINKPPINLKNNNFKINEQSSGAINKTYENWENSLNPLSRNWMINRSNYSFVVNDNQKDISNSILPSIHFDSNSDTRIDEEDIDRKPIEIESSRAFDKIVYDEYISLKNSFSNNGELSSIILPPVLYTFSVIANEGDDDAINGTFTNLGYIDEIKVNSIKINGEFINNKDTKSIIYGGKYKIISIDLTTSSTTLNIKPHELKTRLDTRCRILVEWIANSLTDWCKSTAFLYPPKICLSDWDSVAGMFTSPTNIVDPIFGYGFSKYTKKYIFNSPLEALYYDRLYEFILNKDIK